MTIGKLFKPLRLAGEVVLVRLGLAFIPRLPRRVVLAAAAAAGAVGYLLARGSRRVALANLALAFGNALPAAERRQIARESFAVMARAVADLFWFERDGARRLARWVAIDPGLAPALAAGPVIGVTAHFGNWELLGRALAAAGYRHAAVAAPLINPGVERIFSRARRDDGREIIPRAGALRGALRTLKAGRHLALVMDQNVRPADGGRFVNFFGRPVPMSGAAALLGSRLGASLLPLFCQALPDGAYRVYARPALAAADFTGPDPVRAMTAAIAAVFEDEIRRAPGQWLWMYKRWKHVPPGAAPADYPFYAKAPRQGEHGTPKIEARGRSKNEH